MTGHEIEKKSFAIMDRLMQECRYEEPDRQIVLRIAHATADVEFAGTCVIHPRAMEAGVKAVRSGRNIVTDVRMVQAGIRSAAVEAYGCEVRSFLYDDGVAQEAWAEETTKSAVAMRRAAGFMEGGIVAIGNAPTALFELINLIRKGTARPALIVGTPVGFVGAAESKALCETLEIPFVTNRGDRGGSPVAAAAEFLVSGARSDRVQVTLPRGQAITVAVEDATLAGSGEDRVARCIVKKDAGDDDDITNGSLIWAEVR